MEYIPNILFSLLLVVGVGFFVKNCVRLKRNINLGKAIDRADHKKERWAAMIRIALGQSKMVKKTSSWDFTYCGISRFYHYQY